MPQQDQPRIRKALLAGAVALTLSGTGAAIAWAADPPSPFPPQSAPGQENRQDKKDKPARPDKAERPQLLHSESVVKKADGTFHTVLEQRGTVESVSETAITVRSEDGHAQTYSIASETKVTKLPAPAADRGAGADSGAGADGGKRLRPSDGTIVDITAGEVVRISGVKNGDQATADRIVEGAGDVPGLGRGRGHGLGKGQGKPK